MSGSSQSLLAQKAENIADRQAGQLQGLGLGQLQFLTSVLGDKFGTNWGGIPGEVSRGYDKIRAATEESYRAGATGAREANSYIARTTGGNISGGEVNEAQLMDANALDTRRRLELGQLRLEEANAGMSANNAVMRLFSGAGQSALGMAATYQSQANQAIGGVKNTSPWGSAASGAMAGAGAGAVLGPWGAAGGAVVGGLAGYFGGR